jgi:transcriptional regulator with XRE-family HTH domain
MKSKQSETAPRPVQRVYSYYGLGFRVDLINVPLVEIDHEWVPDIKYNRLEEYMGLAVALKQAALTGYELRFLRRHARLTLDALAGKLGVTRQAIIKWEKRGDLVTRMQPALEKLFRMIMLDAQGIAPEQFKKGFDLIFSARAAGEKYYEVNPQITRDPRRALRKLLAA